ncbi:MAG: hypothetical protein D6812_03455, partial [Deltaproteobacteria bacterium]
PEHFSAEGVSPPQTSGSEPLTLAQKRQAEEMRETARIRSEVVKDPKIQEISRVFGVPVEEMEIRRWPQEES